MMNRYCFLRGHRNYELNGVIVPGARGAFL